MGNLFYSSTDAILERNSIKSQMSWPWPNPNDEEIKRLKQQIQERDERITVLEALLKKNIKEDIND